MDAERVLAFRLQRAGLLERSSSLADGVACPASDFARDAALLAAGARVDGLTREGFDAAVDRGDVVVAHLVRGAIHAVAPEGHGVFGRALVGTDDDELTAQMGEQVRRERARTG